MKSRICIVLIIQLVFASALELKDENEKKCDKVECPSIPKHYEELDCEPVKTEEDCCPTSFKCPDLAAKDPTKCHYKNEVINATQYLKASSIVGMCSAACYCKPGRNDTRAELQCAHIDCPEFFGGENDELPRKCVNQYSRISCCATNKVCDDEIDKLTTCEFGGETYREGQRIYPDEHCYECYCTKDFDNSTAIENNPNCNKVDCGISLRNTGRVIEGCIPVYYQKANCCPIGWRCPGAKHMVETSRSNIDVGPKCTFGKMELKLGESLELEDEDCQKCTCTTPPMLHCIDTC